MEEIYLSFTDEDEVFEAYERKPIPGLIGEYLRDSPLFQNRDVWRLIPNFELDPDYPNNDPYGMRGERNKLWSGVAIRKKGDASKRYVIKEEGAFSILGFVFHYPGNTVAEYYEFWAAAASSDINLENPSEESLRMFWAEDSVYTLMTEYFYAMAVCIKEGLLLVVDQTGRVFNPAENG
jgi:hypothetical protein